MMLGMLGRRSFPFLVGGFNPFETYARQNWVPLSQFSPVKIPKSLSCHHSSNSGADQEDLESFPSFKRRSFTFQGPKASGEKICTLPVANRTGPLRPLPMTFPGEKGSHFLGPPKNASSNR